MVMVKGRPLRGWRSVLPGVPDGASSRLCYQLVSRLLDYPDDTLGPELPRLRAVAGSLPEPLRSPLLPLLDDLSRTPLLDAQARYVETFDLRRRCSPYLTYFLYGDTRKRGAALLRFKTAYRRAGVELSADELPDHLAVVLEFAATVDLEAGRKLLSDHRAGLELMRIALQERDSPYAGAPAAVSATLPRLRGTRAEAVRRLIAEGPPAEDVGLEPSLSTRPKGARR